MESKIFPFCGTSVSIINPMEDSFCARPDVVQQPTNKNNNFPDLLNLLWYNNRITWFRLIEFSQLMTQPLNAKKNQIRDIIPDLTKHFSMLIYSTL